MAVIRMLFRGLEKVNLQSEWGVRDSCDLEFLLIGNVCFSFGILGPGKGGNLNFGLFVGICALIVNQKFLNKAPSMHDKL